MEDQGERLSQLTEENEKLQSMIALLSEEIERSRSESANNLEAAKAELNLSRRVEAKLRGDHDKQAAEIQALKSELEATIKSMEKMQNEYEARIDNLLAQKN